MTDPKHDAPTFANDVDGPQTPSTETTPGTIPQTPLPGHAPSRPQAEEDGTPAPDSPS